jgi:hypothetical protein
MKGFGMRTEDRVRKDRRIDGEEAQRRKIEKA